MKKSYLVEYWGILADQRGSKQETVSSAAATVEQLFGELFVSQDRSWQRVMARALLFYRRCRADEPNHENA
jgi:hypothetical protein